MQLNELKWTLTKSSELDNDERLHYLSVIEEIQEALQQMKETLK